MATKQERGTLASIPKSLHIVHGTLSTPDLLMEQDPQMERELLSKCIVARDRMNRQDRDKDLLSSFLPSLLARNRTKTRNFFHLFGDFRVVFIRSFDHRDWQVVLRTMTIDGFIHSVMRLDKDTFSVYNGLIYPLLSTPLTRHSSYQPINQSICIAIRAERPEKKTIFNQ